MLLYGILSPCMKKRLLVIVAGIVVLIYGCFRIFGKKSGIYSKKKQATIERVNELRSIHWIPVEWDSSELSDRSTMMLQVYIDTISTPFLFQFDLGSSFSNVFRLSKFFPYLKRKEEHNALKLDGNATDAYVDLPIRLGDSLRYIGAKIPIYEYDTLDTLPIEDGYYNSKVGDLGYDLIEDRILIIDFIHSRVAILDSLPPSLGASIEYFDSALVSNDPIFLPIEINGKKKLMEYDNGSSAFTVISDTIAWNQWRDHNAPIDTLSGWSWGQPVHFLKSKAGVPIRFMNKDCSHQPVWAEERQKPASYTEAFAGAIGNEYFRNEIILFDTKHNRFGRFISAP